MSSVKQTLGVLHVNKSSRTSMDTKNEKTVLPSNKFLHGKIACVYRADCYWFSRPLMV